ncbi:MAG: nitrous oxide reductase family maturation protein NosD [Chitinophagaceae bacterium]
MKLIVLSILCLFGFSAAIGKTIQVSAGAKFPTIKSALLVAGNGDSILVSKGVYKEQNIIINKSVFLIGIGRPVLDGEDKYEIITVKADFVIISGFNFVHAGKSSYMDLAALKIINAKDVLIQNNFFENSFFGIYCQQTTRTIIYKNTLYSNAKDEINSANGIHCWKSDQLMILQNTISGHRDGIYFEFVTNSKIENNNSFNNVRYGLHFMFSNYNKYIANIFRDNGAGVAVMFSNHITMHRNVFSENWGNSAYGILMKEISDGDVEGNSFSRNTVGIYLEGSNRIIMRHNHFDDNGWAIKMQASCNDNLVEENNFTANTFDVATNGSLVLNKFRANYWERYEGYDLNRDGKGDIPYRPVSMYSIIVERNPATLMLFRSFMVDLMDRMERLIPGFTPEDLKDEEPKMKMIRF